MGRARVKLVTVRVMIIFYNLLSSDGLWGGKTSYSVHWFLLVCDEKLERTELEVRDSRFL